MQGSAFNAAVEERFLLESVDDQECLLYVDFRVETDRQWLSKATSLGYKELKQAGIKVLRVVTYKDPREYLLKAIGSTHQWLQ